MVAVLPPENRREFTQLGCLLMMTRAVGITESSIRADSNYTQERE